MKQANSKNEASLKLDRRLMLVRTTIRELNPAQLQEVNGGWGANAMVFPTCSEVMTV